MRRNMLLESIYYSELKGQLKGQYTKNDLVKAMYQAYKLYPKAFEGYKYFFLNNANEDYENLKKDGCFINDTINWDKIDSYLLNLKTDIRTVVAAQVFEKSLKGTAKTSKPKELTR